MPKRILCIDGDPDLSARLSRELDRLPRFDYELAHVVSADDLDAVRLGEFDLVFMDHRLGKVSGRDVLGRLRDSEFDGPVIVLSDQTDPQIAVRLVQCGADEYLAKRQLDARCLERAISGAETRRRRKAARDSSTLRRELHALERAKEIAEAVSRSKSEFLATVSHEIRTPLTAILGYAEELRREELPDADRLEAVEVIRENGEFLLRVVGDILDLSKIEAGKLEIERVPISPMQIVADACRLMAARAREKGVRLEHGVRGEVPETILSDPTRVRQILVNLIGNAVKFTEGGTVSVHARLLEETGAAPAIDADDAPQFAANERRLEVEIADTGVGMTEGQIARIFEAFSQADGSISREHGGTGLGLTISERLARRLGGGIRVESAAGKGSVFRVSLACGPLEGVRRITGPVSGPGRPVRTRTGARNWDSRGDVAAPPILGRRHRLPPCRVLLGEDNPMNRKLISAIVERFGAAVTTAENGRDVVRLAGEGDRAGRPVDLVLMDLQMPELDGFQAARRLRKAGFGRPIVALSGQATESGRMECLEAGFDDFVTKPIRRDRLFEVLRDCLGPPGPTPVRCESASPTAERKPE